MLESAVALAQVKGTNFVEEREIVSHLLILWE